MVKFSKLKPLEFKVMKITVIVKRRVLTVGQTNARHFVLPPPSFVQCQITSTHTTIQQILGKSQHTDGFDENEKGSYLYTMTFTIIRFQSN